MNSRRNPRHLLATLLVGVLVGGGLMATTPAGAAVAQVAATNWKKIWRKDLQPLADKRYYKKSASDAKYATRTETSSALANFYTKTGSDARYQPKGSYAPAGSSYTKSESDARYAPVQPLYRGTYMFEGRATASSQGVAAVGISFGATFPTAPTPHYIKVGDPIPAGCSGTAAAPDAAPGHLCVFESSAFNAGGNRGICNGGASMCDATDAFGAALYTFSAGAGGVEVLGTWAARPSGPVVNPARFSPAAPGATNGTSSSGTSSSGTALSGTASSGH